MIAKHVNMAHAKKENIYHLNQYLKHGRDNLELNERVLFSFTQNCIGEEPDEVLTEMKMMSRLNTRASGEKFAHIILSLRPGEHLKKEQWQHAVETTLNALKMQDHQAIAYVHQDTDAEHLHLVVNRINPKTLNKNVMSYDYKVLAQVCDNLEKEFNLQIDNHQKNPEKMNKHVEEIEHLSGEQSFISYVTTFKEQLLQAKSWQEIHEICKKHNVELQKGRGLTFKTVLDETEYVTKASSIDRELSLSKLETKLGKFTAAQPSTEKIIPESSYTADPVGYKLSSRVLNELHSLYRQEKKKNRALKLNLFSQEIAHYQKQKKKLQNWKRKALRLAYLTYKKDLTALNLEKQRILNLAQMNLQEIERIHKQDVRKINKRLKLSTFNDWLRQNHLKNDQTINTESLAALRSRDGSMSISSDNEILGEQKSFVAIFTSVFFKLKKRTTKGQDIFGSEIARGDLIRDDGNKICVSSKPSLITVAEVLNLAKQRFDTSKPLLINGSRTFQEQCALLAVQMGLNISLSDPQAQKYYLTIKEDQYERSRYGNRPRLGELGRQFGRTRGAYGGDFTRNFDNINRFTDIYTFAGLNRLTTETGISDGERRNNIISDSDSIRERGQSSAKETTTGLHVQNMQSSNLDKKEQRSAMLLHSNASNIMGTQKGETRDKLRSDVRREISDRRAATQETEQEAIDTPLSKFIKERNQKHQQGFKDVLEHREYKNESGVFKYIGTRNIGDNAYILVMKDNIIYIKSCSSYELRRLKQLGKNTSVSISADGKVSVQRKQTRHR